MSLDDHPRALAADVFNEIITAIKESRPTRTDGTSTTGFVYAMARPGQMVSPRSFGRPWSPFGGTPPVGGAVPPAGAAAPPAPVGDAKRAQEAAFRTAQMFDDLLMVTNDGTTQPYSGGGRKLSLQYDALLQAMEAPAPPERSADVVAKVDAATKILWESHGKETPEYAAYLANQRAVSKARGEMEAARVKAMTNPATADSWPIIGVEYIDLVNQAFDRWTKSPDTEKIEAALATLGALGIPMEQGMIDDARKRHEAWKVAIGGVADKTPYTYIEPTEWCEIAADDIGWTTVERVSNEYENHFNSHGYKLSTGDWSGSSSSTSGSAGISIFGFGFGGSYAESQSQSHNAFSNAATDGTQLRNTAKNLSITLQYGMARIMRPWLTTDLFQMQNWYLRGERKGCISDGTIHGQVADREGKLPMIPTHVLIVRNVEITSIEWGEDEDTLKSYWNSHQDTSMSSSSSVGANVSIPVWGPLSLTGGFSHDSADYQGDFKDEAGQAVRDDAGAHFEGDTLRIRGAQIVAWLGEVLPLCPPLDDPALENG